ncbi:MAG: cytochrome [Hydrocarboniphaga sp.]|uniref:cytochrome P450 n=1 Tax=Hydrocarboniphaga sp. TaxID=2033016 RepID=UPI002614E859|nr:cytochrome P450 [Hydrocarboniphaga sp.]MDB5970182.1 cytochrome [Hydrocarboniphaga sp.]
MGKQTGQQLVEKFDHTSPEQMNQPYAMYQAFRSQCPVGRSAQHGGFHVASRYETVKKIFEDYSSFSSTSGVAIPDHPYRMFPIDLDPPLQAKFRRILNRKFTIESVATKQAEIQGAIDHLIDGFIATGKADLAAQLVRPLLPTIVLPLLGAPIESQQQISEWIELMTRGRASDIEGVARAGEAIAGVLMTQIAKRRTMPPIDDVLGMLLDSQIDGKPFTDEDIYRTLLIILFGGLDTTSAVMLESLLYLARHPETRQRLVSGELSWPTAIEEFIRYTSPIQGLRRTVTGDVELEGASLKSGDRILGLHGSANRDESVFPQADQCLLDRAPNPHIAFGAGAHVCLGRNLARLEIEILLKTVLARLGDYRVADDFEPEYLVGEARGMKQLLVDFTPGLKTGQ